MNFRLYKATAEIAEQYALFSKQWEMFVGVSEKIFYEVAERSAVVFIVKDLPFFSGRIVFIKITMRKKDCPGEENIGKSSFLSEVFCNVVFQGIHGVAGLTKWSSRVMSHLAILACVFPYSGFSRHLS